MPHVARRLRARISLASFAALATMVGVAAALIGVAVVTFGALNAYRYDGVRIAGFRRPLTLYSIPGQHSSTVVACYGSDAADRSACESMVASFDATLDPFGAVTYALTPSATYARHV